LEILPEIESIDLVLTDPPYNFESLGGGFYGVNWHNAAAEPRTYINRLKEINCVDFIPEKMLSILPCLYGYFFCNKFLILNYLSFANENNLLYDLLIMHKTNPIPAKHSHYLHDIEYIVMMRPKASPFFCKDYSLMSKVYTTSCGGDKLHPAEKPTGLMRKFIEVSCPVNGTVLDPFMGSGTTLVAAKQLGRKAIGIELEEKYIEIAIRRLSQAMLPFS
jgi:DNA modification methylase